MAYPPVVVVNEKDEVVGAEMLNKVWEQGLYHRIVRVMAEDPAGRVLLQRRSAHMNLYPDCWDHSAAGHVDEGDSYEDAAKRETQEEIGIHDVPLEPIATYRTNGEFKGRILNRFNRLYRARIPAGTDMQVDPHEVGEVRWFTPGELRTLITEHPETCTPDLVQVLKEYYLS